MSWLSSTSVRGRDREWTVADERPAAGIAADARCDRCAGRFADCLVCGNRSRSADWLLDEEFEGS